MPGLQIQSRETVARSQRSRLIEAMAESCAERGLAAATISDIVARAGMGRATFYKLFEGKDECFRAAVNEVVGDLSRAIGTAVAEGEEWPVTVRRVFEAVTEILADRPAFAQLAFLESRAVDLELLEPYRNAFFALIETGPPGDSPFPADSEQSAQLVYGQVQAMFIAAGVAGTVEDLPEQIPTLAYLAMLPGLGPEAAAREARLRA